MIIFIIYSQDRLKLGSNSLYLYVGFPNERKPSDDINKYDHDFFQTELAEGVGGFYSMAVTSGGQDAVLDAETQLVFSEFIDLMPKIQEANTISEELRTVNFAATSLVLELPILFDISTEYY